MEDEVPLVLKAVRGLASSQASLVLSCAESDSSWTPRDTAEARSSVCLSLLLLALILPDPDICGNSMCCLVCGEHGEHAAGESFVVWVAVGSSPVQQIMVQQVEYWPIASKSRNFPTTTTEFRRRSYTNRQFMGEFVALLGWYVHEAFLLLGLGLADRAVWLDKHIRAHLAPKKVDGVVPTQIIQVLRSARQPQSSLTVTSSSRRNGVDSSPAILYR
jgi:hypothetical protein